METKLKSIGLVLVGSLLIFGSICTVAWAGKLPAVAELNYPESLDQVMGFHEDFAKPGSSVKLGILSSDELTKSTTFDSSLSDLTGFSFFEDSEDEEAFQGVVAINTKRRNTVTSQGQFESVPTDMNYMDIDVRNIIVISINTARGGNAIATSEIFIEPTQKA
ncbi:MAG TPA: hypothetical protein PLM24_05460 [Methanothrix sp.]|nr:hypothetical protein [Methanothrix sp.]HPJ84535.1 hypothetical protein [Methanothrix sp.]HPR66567.1 hypothetical protein [Methanothrix sp.]